MIYDAHKLDEFCKSIVGKTYEDVEVICERSGLQLRTTKIDGQPLMKTNDYRPGRINVHLQNGKVEHAHYG